MQGPIVANPSRNSRSHDLAKPHPSRPVEALSATLVQLAATPMPTAMPDLARSLDLVRTQRVARDRPPDRVPAAAPPPRGK